MDNCSILLRANYYQISEEYIHLKEHCLIYGLPIKTQASSEKLAYPLSFFEMYT